MNHQIFAVIAIVPYLDSVAIKVVSYRITFVNAEMSEYIQVSQSDLFCKGCLSTCGSSFIKG